MLYGLLIIGYIFICILLVLLILIQKGKGSTGFGVSSQMLFGGSGGQDIFQKTTWVLGALFMVGSLLLTVLTTRQSQSLSYTPSYTTVPLQRPTSSTQPSTSAYPDNAE